ncbi:hypothetical protein ACWENQ_25275 [Nonomuraea sp. NPDC004354]
MPYPISSSASLRPVERQRWRKAARAVDEIPMPLPHEVVVLAVGGGHVRSDEKSLGPADEHVVNATGYSVVDMRKDQPVEVDLTLPSSGLDEFLLRVIFTCSVTDPITVARNGHTDLAVPLQAYVKGYHRIHQLGLDHPIEARASVQDDALTELSIYSQAQPPLVSGMLVRLAAIEVLTPDEVIAEKRAAEQEAKDHERKRREMAFEHDLTARRRTYEMDDLRQEHDLTVRRRAYQMDDLQQEHDLTARRRGYEMDDLQHEQDRTRVERRFAHELDREETEFELEQRQRRLAADLRHARTFHEETGSDPYAVISYAVARGELSSTELMRRLDEAEQVRRNLDEQERRRRLEWEADRDKREWEAFQEVRAFERQKELRAQELDAAQDEREFELRKEGLRLGQEKESRQQEWELSREDRTWARHKEEFQLQWEKEQRAQQLEAAKEERDHELRKEELRLKQEQEQLKQQLAAQREQREWEAGRAQQDWEREKERQEILIAQENRQNLATLTGKAIDRGLADHSDMGQFLIEQLIDNGTPAEARTAVTPAQQASALESSGQDDDMSAPREESVGDD